MDAKMVTVGASCTDEKGRGDGAYDLLGIWTVEEFVTKLREVLNYDWGLSNAEGEVTLNIHIRKDVHKDG